jgi:pilus assembly protein Flp/PilA
MTYVQYLKRFLRDEDGVTAIEYGLIAGLIAVFMIAAVTSVGVEVGNVFDAVKGALDKATP